MFDIKRQPELCLVDVWNQSSNVKLQPYFGAVYIYKIKALKCFLLHSVFFLRKHLFALARILLPRLITFIFIVICACYSCCLSTATIEYSSACVCVSVCVSVCLSVCLCVCLSVCVSVSTITQKIINLGT